MKQFLFAMDQDLQSQNRSFAARKPRLYVLLMVSGFILLGGVAGLLVGAFLFTYFIPFWSHTEIDIEGHMFSEITVVEFFLSTNFDPSKDNVILKTEDGEYYSYNQYKWQQTELSDIDLTKFHHNSCNEWAGPPPASYLKRTEDMAGVDYEHPLAHVSRCYILFPNGSLELWTRDINVGHLFYVRVSTLVLGVLAGAITGGIIAHRKINDTPK